MNVKFDFIQVPPLEITAHKTTWSILNAGCIIGSCVLSLWKCVVCMCVCLCACAHQELLH